MAMRMLLGALLVCDVYYVAPDVVAGVDVVDYVYVAVAGVVDAAGGVDEYVE